MNKIFLIIEREYLTRVRKKSFILMTILSPILFAGMAIVPALLSMVESRTAYSVGIVDKAGLYQGCFATNSAVEYVNKEPSFDVATVDFEAEAEGREDAYLVLSDDLLVNPEGAKLYSGSPITLDVRNDISVKLEQFLRKKLIQRAQSPQTEQLLTQIEAINVQLPNITIGKDGKENKSAVEMAMAISMIFAFLSYGLIIGYGAQVMRGVSEEKNNRIVEIIISSVKPFQLMLGKIIGIALVALTQFLVWIVLTISIVTVVKFVALPIGDTNAVAQAGVTVESTVQGGGSFGSFVTDNVKGIDVTYLLSLFGFYFIAGYLLYAALFAAVGSAIDPDSDTQQFVLPVMMPLILSIVVAMNAARDPNGAVAFWGSIIPFTSPVIMMARIPYEVPLWQLLLSGSLLVATFVFFTYLAGRVYRVGILMYGKKVTYKEIWKWIRYS